MTTELPKFNTPFLNEYLAMVEDTESPRLFHIWSAVGAMAASLGRRCYLPFGPMVIYPNHYILLVGTPGTRKSTAGSIMKRQLKASTGVRFAPQDTAGQRQGLVEAMRGGDSPKEFLGAVELAFADKSLAALTLDDIAEISDQPESEDDELRFIAQADKHHLMVIASEFSRFIGQNNIQMLDFLTTMWDGDDYEYRIKSAEVILKNPLLNLVGATTPTSLALSMPPAAGGQGFLSRIILVYGSRKHKLVPRPGVPPLEFVDRVKSRLNTAYYEIAGAFQETEDARVFSESLYNYTLEITDPRFGYYNERRYTHLIKLAMVLAAGRGSGVIVKDDYDEAHRILRATERGMPDALGEFGMNPLAALKQNMLEYLRANVRMPMEQLRSVFHREARSQEFTEVVNDLVKANQITMIQQKGTGVMWVHAQFSMKHVEDSIMDAFAD